MWLAPGGGETGGETGGAAGFSLVPLTWRGPWKLGQAGQAARLAVLGRWEPLGERCGGRRSLADCLQFGPEIALRRCNTNRLPASCPSQKFCSRHSLVQSLRRYPKALFGPSERPSNASEQCRRLAPAMSHHVCFRFCHIPTEQLQKPSGMCSPQMQRSRSHNSSSISSSHPSDL